MNKIKKIIDKFKKTFLYNLMSSGIGIALVIFVALLIIFHDYSCERKVVKMKEDVMYIKPVSKIENEK